MDELKIYHRPGTNLFFTGVFLLAAISYLVFAEGRYWQPLFAVVLFLVTGIFGVMSLYESTREDPVLVIGPEGILDNIAGFGLIPWSDIEEVEIVVLNHSTLGVRFKDPEKYGLSTTGASSAWRSFIAKGRATIPLPNYGRDSKEVIAAARHFLEASRK